MVDIGSLEPDWNAFRLHIKRLSSESETDLLEAMRDQCLEASRLLEETASEVSLHVPSTSSPVAYVHANQATRQLSTSCQMYLDRLEDRQNLRELFDLPLQPFPCIN